MIRRCEHCGGHSRKGWENRLGLFTRANGTDHFVHMGCWAEWDAALPEIDHDGVCEVCGMPGTAANPIGFAMTEEWPRPLQEGNASGRVGHVTCLTALKWGASDGQS